MKLEERVAAFELLDIPIWVFDFERTVMVWGNAPALALWRAENLDALRRRDFSQVSDAVRARWQATLARMNQGETVHEQFTFYPRGEAVSMDCYQSAIELDDGRTAMLIRAQPESRVDPALVRGIEAVRHTSALIALLDEAGTVLMQNPASIRAFGVQTTFFSWPEGAKLGAAVLSAVTAGEVFTGEHQIRTQNGERWYAIEARAALDPATGSAAVLMQMLDITVQREMAGALERQRRQISVLAVPILSLGATTLALPLVGELDRERGTMLAEKLLPAIVEKEAEHVILDVTGLEEFDAESVEHLVRIIRAVELLGARPLLTGVGPELSRRMVSMQVELGGVRILRDLRDALQVVEGRRAKNWPQGPGP